MNFFSLVFCLFAVLPLTATAQSASTNLGITTEEFNGKVEGFGVVWALRVTKVEPGSRPEQSDIQAGDVIISVARFAPIREETGDQAGMLRLLEMAEGGDRYLVTRVRPSDDSMLPEEIAFEADYNTGSLVLAGVTGNRSLFAQIFTEDWDRALGRFGSGGEPQGARRWLDALNYGYHENFQAICDMDEFRPYREWTEQLVHKKREVLSGRLIDQTPGAIFVHRVRSEFWLSWRDSYSRMSGIDVLMRANTYDGLGRDINALIRANGCHSDDLRLFEQRLAEATEMAWR